MEDIIKDYDDKINTKINELRNQARLLQSVTDGSIDWGHHISWDVEPNNKNGARKELIERLRIETENLLNEYDKFEILINTEDK